MPRLAASWPAGLAALPAPAAALATESHSDPFVQPVHSSATQSLCLVSTSLNRPVGLCRPNPLLSYADVSSLIRRAWQLLPSLPPPGSSLARSTFSAPASSS
uniref:(northern house mosquito) hypothetical protein n=1 Tax=Culex pipiens TaxID=7175 RepID=A0A8D8BQA0_CULPI